MEKELNIAAILKEKPQNTRLWSPTVGECNLIAVVDDKYYKYPIKTRSEENINVDFMKNGNFAKNGEICLFPSKQMQDWSKFAWKKGDVLADDCGNYSIFVEFDKGTGYANVILDFLCNLGDSVVDYDGGKSSYPTQDWSKAPDEEAKKVISHIEKYLNGKLNLETLKIEHPEQEFEDGDIRLIERNKRYAKCIFITKCCYSNKVDVHALYNCSTNEIYFDEHTSVTIDNRWSRHATEEEKQQLFSALANEGKRWNPDTKQIEDLSKKCEFKVFGKVLVRDRYNDEWMAGFFSHYIESSKDFVCTSGSWKQCIPYNEETAHLLGTTDEWKGGNNG